MYRCSVIPYEEKEDYIFISYSHMDKRLVFPILEKLADEGYRIWYDEGIAPGSEWPEVIASHLAGCKVFIAFLTSNYLNSLNCKRELNFAISKKKDFISVYLEPLELSPGIEMQITVTQSVFRYNTTENAFYEKLFSADYLASCKGDKSDVKRIDRSDEQDDEIPTENSDFYLRGSDHDKQFVLPIGKFTVGSQDGCDLILRQNGIDKLHATFLVGETVSVLVDNSSANGTFINDIRIPPDVEKKLNVGDRIRFDTVVFEFCSVRQLSPGAEDESDLKLFLDSVHPDLPEPETDTKEEKKSDKKSAEKKNKAGKQPVPRDVKKKSGNNKKTLRAVFICAIIVIAATIGFFIKKSVMTVEIAGKKYDISLTGEGFSNVNFTLDDIRELNKLKKAIYLSFSSCSFESIADLKVSENLNNIRFTECTGIDSFFFLECMKEDSSVAFINCDVPEDVFKYELSDGCIQSCAVRQFEISDCPGLTFCPDLSGFSRLKELDLSGDNVPSIGKGLIPMGLQKLDVSGNTELTDLSGMIGSDLRSFSCSGCNKADLSLLSSFDGFTDLDLSDCALTSLPLNGNAALKTLRVQGNDLSDISCIADCESLNVLDISGNAQLNESNTESIGHFIQLKEFYASDCGFTDISGILNNCTRLEKVSFTDNRIADFSVLAKSADTLTKVYIGGNQAVDLDFLSDASGLIELECYSNQITSLAPLAAAGELQSICAENNKITNCQGLVSLKLKTVCLENNEITQIDDLPVSDYSLLDLYNNNINHYPDLKACSIETFIIAGNPGLVDSPPKCEYMIYDYGTIVEKTIFGSYWGVAFYCVDCPLDKQLDEKDSFTNTSCDFISGDQLNGVLTELVPTRHIAQNTISASTENGE